MIKSWVSVGNEEAAKNAEAILAAMEELNKAGDEESKPDDISYNSCINAWSLCGNPEGAERILRKMKSPNVVSYNSVLQAWVRSDLAETGERVIELLDEMESKVHVDNVIEPDHVTYNMCIKGLLRFKYDLDSIKLAEKLLGKAESIAKGKGTKLNISIYGSIIHACRKCDNAEAAYIANRGKLSSSIFFPRALE